MWSNYLKIALRNLRKNKTHTGINLMGLTIGISAAILIFAIIRFDTSFDDYHEDTDRIFRLVQSENTAGDLSYSTGIPFPLRLSFKDDFSEVEYFTLVDNNTDDIISFERNGEKVKFQEDNTVGCFVMADYFRIFNYSFLHGSPATIFEHKHSVVLSKRMAEKYFGTYQQAIGQEIRLNNKYDVSVSGIVENAPHNTDLPFQIFVNFQVGEKDRTWDSWSATSNSVHGYIKLKENVAMASFSDKLLGYVQSHLSPNYPSEIKIYSQPLNEVHSDPKFGTFSGRIASNRENFTLVLIGALLLLAACINFINLNTALAVKRSKEIGVRKVLGSNRAALVAQFLCETAILTFVAMILSLGLSQIVIKHIEYFIGYSVPGLQIDGIFAVSVLLLFLLVTLLSGLYPSFVLSGFKPILALKNKIQYQQKGSLSLRKSLIVVQLVISQVLIVAVIVVTQQIDHFLTTPIGVNSEGIMEFGIPDNEGMDYEALKVRLLELDGVEKVSFSNTGSTSYNTWGGIARMTVDTSLIVQQMQVKIIDKSYLETYGISLVAGRNISNDTVRSYLLSEKAVEQLGFSSPEQAIGLTMRIWGKNAAVIGVVEDFHSTSLHDQIEPMAFWYDPTHLNNTAIKLGEGDWKTTIASAQNIWEEYFPNYIFQYSFLDETIEQFYVNEERLSKTFSLFTVIALFIGGIGLLGLMSYLVSARTKEIGVRKILGARLAQILTLLTMDFVKMVGIAFIVAVPVSWYFMHEWLKDFESKIEISLWIYLSAFMVSLLITLLIIGWKSFRAAVTNPVEALKYE